MQNIDSFNEQIEMQKLLNESNSVFFFWYLLHQLEENKKNRIKSIDIAKAIGIFLIVLGHTLEFGELRKFIYSFHVPLFFFLSGLCFSRKKNIIFIKKKILTIYVPYLIVGKHVFSGYSESMNSDIKNKINETIKDKYDIYKEIKSN